LHATRRRVRLPTQAVCGRGGRLPRHRMRWGLWRGDGEQLQQQTARGGSVGSERHAEADPPPTDAGGNDGWRNDSSIMLLFTAEALRRGGRNQPFTSFERLTGAGGPLASSL